MYSSVLLQSQGVGRQIVDAIGLGSVADMYGVYPVLGGAIGVIVLVLLTVGGGGRVLKRVQGASRRKIAGNIRSEVSDASSTDEVVETVKDEDEEILNEATKRLEYDDKKVTGENIKSVLEEIEQEQENVDDGNVQTGILNDEEDRTPVARMSVGPNKVEEEEDHITIRNDSNEKIYSRTLIVSSYPDRVNYGWLDKLFSSGLETKGSDVRTIYHIWPRDTSTMMQKLNTQATRLTSTIRQKQKEGKINTIEEEQKRSKINKLRSRLSKGSTNIYDFALYVQVTAKNKEALNDGTEEVKQLFAQSNARLSPLIDRQKDAFRTGAPLGQDRIRKTQIMDKRSLGTTFPFIEPTRVQATGVLLGFHHTTSSPVIVDRFELSGHNALISGKIGSGKSYLAKLMMWRRLMMDPETELMIVDPVGGFGDMVEAIGGQVIEIDSETIINPLEIKEAKEQSGSVDEDPFDMKIRSVMGMFKTHFSGDRTLTKGEEGVLRRAVKFAYLEKGITKNPRTHSNESPIIDDVIDILTKISQGKRPKDFLDIDEDMMKYVGIVTKADETEEATEASKENEKREAGFAHQVVLGLEEFRQGGQRSNLNGHTNIDLDARVVQFNLENVVDANNAGLIMHIVLDYLFQRTKSSLGRSLITIDEAHYMLNEEGPTKVLNTFVRHSRHYKSGVTLISQTVDEFMEEKAKEIYDQCDVRLLMRHEDLGEEAMDALDLEEPERDFVLSAQAGNTSDHSEALLITTDNGKRRLRVYSNTFEHHVVDSDSDNVWTLLYSQGTVSWEAIPDAKKGIVKREVGQKKQAASA